MDIPDVKHAMWKTAITQNTQLDLEVLAVKILLSRLRLLVKQKPDTVDQCARELRDLFVKMIHMPKAQEDLMKLMKQGGVK